MNKNLNNAIFNIGKVDALMQAIEGELLNLEVLPENRTEIDRCTYLFYALWDEIKMVGDNLEKLSGDSRVVDVIYAVNSIRKEESA